MPLGLSFSESCFGPSQVALWAQASIIIGVDAMKYKPNNNPLRYRVVRDAKLLDFLRYILGVLNINYLQK
jgi:hypothetical protein